MNDLRWILLGIGVLIMTMIYCQAMYGRRRSERSHVRRIAPLESASREHKAGGSADERIVSLIVKAPPDRPFIGTEIVETATALGLQFGEMGIFHDYGDGDLASGRAIFSIADLYEPGEFDLDGPAVAAHRTGGLSLFMRLPSPIEAGVAFDRMREAAFRLAAALGGEVCRSDGELLDEASVSLIRAGLY